MDNKMYKKEKLCKNQRCLQSGDMSFFTLSTAENTEDYCSIRCQEAVEGRPIVQVQVQDIRAGSRNASLRMGL